MKVIDISWPITQDMTAYKDKHVVTLEQTKQFEEDKVRETLITLSSHTGTHIDAPAHFMKDGIPIDQYDPLHCVGSALVIDMTDVDTCIDQKHLHNVSIEPGMIVLFKTKNSAHAATAPFDYNFVYINALAADYLVKQSIRAVGIDYLGIERNQPDHETHKAFMQHNIPIIEGLRLEQAQSGTYFLWCLPLKMPGLDGAPARALLIQNDET